MEKDMQEAGGLSSYQKAILSKFWDCPLAHKRDVTLVEAL